MSGEHEFLRELKVEIEIELTEVQASHAEEAMRLPVTDWLFDPTEAEREEIGLRGLRAAVEVLEVEVHEDDSRPGSRGTREVGGASHAIASSQPGAVPATILDATDR